MGGRENHPERKGKKVEKGFLRLELCQQDQSHHHHHTHGTQLFSNFLQSESKEKKK